jgi:hypothetical protein
MRELTARRSGRGRVSEHESEHKDRTSMGVHLVDCCCKSLIPLNFDAMGGQGKVGMVQKEHHLIWLSSSGEAKRNIKKGEEKKKRTDFTSKPSPTSH